MFFFDRNSKFSDPDTHNLLIAKQKLLEFNCYFRSLILGYYHGHVHMNGAQINKEGK